MRPLRLTFQAFGSYAGTVTVDFARLARHGIFAIAGPTGAGKSTLFDALVYALYDDLPGFRVHGHVRSQYADSAVETRVRLEFEVRGERWAVERTPAQQLVRRRGQGPAIERKSTVLLERLDADGRPVEGSGTSRKAMVADRIEALVGLSKAQFEQVILIPQGRFEEVLKADTRVRSALLRRLFPVDVYGRVSAALKAMADSRQVAFADAERAFADLIERLRSALVAARVAAGLDTHELEDPGSFQVEQMATHLSTLSSARTMLERAMATAQSGHDQALAALQDARTSAAAWDRWQADVSCAARFAQEEAADAAEADRLRRARRIADLGGALEAWEESAAQLLRGERQRSALVDRLRTACASLGRAVERADVEDAHGAGRLAERLRRDAEDLADRIAGRDGLVAQRRALEARHAALVARRRETNARVASVEDERRALDLLAGEIDALEQAAMSVPAAESAAGSLDAERAICLRRADAAMALRAAERVHQVAVARAAAAKEQLDAVRAAWRDGLAGRLADLLVDGHACPTCGARDHPSPARRPEHAPDDEALAAAESAAEAAQIALRDGLDRLASARASVTALPDSRPLEDVESELTSRRDELARGLEAARRRETARASLAERRPALERARTALEVGVRRLESDEAVLEAERGAHLRASEDFEARYGSLQSLTGTPAVFVAAADDADRLSQLLSSLRDAQVSQDRCASLLAPVLDELGLDEVGMLAPLRLDSQELVQRTEALASREKERAEVRDRIAAYKASGGGAPRPDVASFEEAAAQARAAHLELVRRHAVMEENAAYFSAGPSLLETATKEVDATRQALEQVRTMADRCAGAGGGASPTRLSLENWVLADYLRQVLAQANERLATMTAGRFSLELSDEVADGRKPFGLDLSAFDAYTGQVRPATTLSGGETFMAALALALGLADVVSGGSNRQMGALFVDEGFGSLDPQSLDAVVDVLRTLEDGGRLVGVVSHVEAVQQALGNGITVRTTPCGSQAEVHYPPE